MTALVLWLDYYPPPHEDEHKRCLEIPNLRSHANLKYSRLIRGVFIKLFLLQYITIRVKC